MFSLFVVSLIIDKCGVMRQVIRGGRRVDISIFDIVVGDVIPLKIGDQVNELELIFSVVSIRYIY